MSDKIIFHIDVNSAFLSWHQAYYRQIGRDENLLEDYYAIGGNEKKRHGIVLAKSIPAKKMGVKTGQSLMEARQICPKLKVIPPRYDVYVKASKKLRELLMSYTPLVEVFSIDECFMDMSGTSIIQKSVEKGAFFLKEKVKKEFGYTVNIGISNCKLLAKQASEFEKPDKVHTLFPEEVPHKLWPLPVEELFMVGNKTKIKLQRIGIETIEQLASCETSLLETLMKSHGRLIQQYAKGIDDSIFVKKEGLPFKGIGNGSTIAFDVIDQETARHILLSLVETASARLREANLVCNVVSVGIKSSEFLNFGKQRKLSFFTDVTQTLYQEAIQLFSEIWDGKPIRHFSVRFSNLEWSYRKQIHWFNSQIDYKMEALDPVIDRIRDKYGTYSVMRGCYVHSGLEPLLGGYPDDDYPDMSSLL